MLGLEATASKQAECIYAYIKEYTNKPMQGITIAELMRIYRKHCKRSISLLTAQIARKKYLNQGWLEYDTDHPVMIVWMVACERQYTPESLYRKVIRLKPTSRVGGAKLGNNAFTRLQSANKSYWFGNINNIRQICKMVAMALDSK